MRLFVTGVTGLLGSNVVKVAAEICSACQNMAPRCVKWPERKVVYGENMAIIDCDEYKP